MLIAPLVHLETIDLAVANDALVRWDHKMGPVNRPIGLALAHGLFSSGDLVAVTVSADLVRETCAGLNRSQAVELARLCASRPGICRVMLRLWREFVFPALRQSGGWQWAVSYQDEGMHSGNTYRFDGWVQLGRSRSGTDHRSGRKGRSKTIWGWHDDAAQRKAMKEAAA